MLCPFATSAPSPNHAPGGMAAEPLGVVLHIEQGTEAGTIAWFHNPKAQVSAHFGVGKDGAITQFVDTADAAWAECEGNTEWLSIEHEGFTGEALTPAQLTADARLIAWLKSTEGGAGLSFPLQTTDDPTRPGLGWHGMGGAAWGNHPNCPGDPIKAQRLAILADALSLIHQVPLPPAPEPEPPAPPPPAPPPPAPAPTPPAPPWPGRYLRQPPMTHGGDVANWQARMHERGWTIGVDGWYGPQSMAVCEAFQREKGLAVDGIVGPVTWRAAWVSPIT